MTKITKRTASETTSKGTAISATVDGRVATDVTTILPSSFVTPDGRLVGTRGQALHICVSGNFYDDENLSVKVNKSTIKEVIEKHGGQVDEKVVPGQTTMLLVGILKENSTKQIDFDEKVGPCNGMIMEIHEFLRAIGEEAPPLPSPPSDHQMDETEHPDEYKIKQHICLHPDDCSNSAVGMTYLCGAHGGGPRCMHPNGCGKCASDVAPQHIYGTRGRCMVHSIVGTKKRYTCTVKSCWIGVFGADIYCSRHGGRYVRLPNARGIKQQNQCKEKGCKAFGRRRGFRKVCVGCFDRLYPNEPRLRRNHLFKEKAIRKAIYESSILSDALGRVIWEGGLFPNQSTYLPDMWIDCGTHFVVVEIDEHAHRAAGYHKLKYQELRRMQALHSAGRKPIIFIRFNPDGYITDYETLKNKRSGKRVSSCFGYVRHRRTASAIRRGPDRIKRAHRGPGSNNLGCHGRGRAVERWPPGSLPLL